MVSSRKFSSHNIEQFINSNLIQPNDKILVAVSGGMDSMLLLHMLKELQNIENIELIVGHINHNIRPNSIDDENFVIEQGRKYSIQVVVKRLNFSNRVSGESTEAWARKNRYEQLETIRRKSNYDKIATAHHRNDQIETVLQRLSEKAGISGLRGIHPQYGKIIRPILTISKKDIERAVKDLQIQYVTDETNQSLEMTRNYIRHKVVPPWEMIYPNLGESIEAICQSANENQTILNYFIDNLTNNIVINETDKSKNNGTIHIDRNKFDVLPEAVKKIMVNNLIGKSPLRKYQWEELAKILKSAKIGKVYNFNDFEILKDRQEWIIRHKFNVNLKAIIVELNKTVQIGNIDYKVSEVSNYSFTNNACIEIIDRSYIVGKIIVLRPWHEGDEFQPLGMSGKKKISDFLIDEKINQFDKEHQFVLTADGEIIWLCGKRISERVKIKKDTEQFLELSMRTNVG